MRFRTAAGPGLHVEVDDTCNVVLVHTSNLGGKETRLDVCDVEALRSALDAGRTMARVHEEISRQPKGVPL